MELESTNSGPTAKLPILKLGEYEIFEGNAATRKTKKNSLEGNIMRISGIKSVVRDYGAWISEPSTSSTMMLTTAFHKLVLLALVLMLTVTQVCKASVSDYTVTRIDVASTFYVGGAKKYYQRTGKKIFINANDTAGNKEHQEVRQEEQVQTNMALMAISDSEVYTDKSCSKTCMKNYKTLKKQCDDLLVKINESEFKVATYKRGQRAEFTRLWSEYVSKSLNVVSDKESDNSKDNFDESLVASHNIMIKGLFDSGAHGAHDWETCLSLSDFKEFGGENLVDKKVKIIRSDNGTEFKNKVMDDFCREKGIKREYSVARTPHQNGVAERRNMTLIEAARTMLADSKLPTTFWAEAISTACYVQNRFRKVSTGQKVLKVYLLVIPLVLKPVRVYNTRTSTSEENSQDSIVMPIWKDTSYFDSVLLWFVDNSSTKDVNAARQQVNTVSLIKKAIGTKWVFKNKKDERGIVIRNKARIEANKELFLAYASFMGFLVYQMDVKSAFLYGTIEEEVYVTQPPGFKNPNIQKSLQVVMHFMGDDAVHKELGDRMERAATTASSLEAEQDSDTILGDVNAQTRFEITSKQSIDPLLSRGYTLGSGEDSMKLIGIDEICPKFAETHNVVEFLEKPEESDGFAEIIDFLKASSVSYALSVNPLQALVDKKRVIVTESSIRTDLHLDDAEGTDCLPTATIFEELARMGAKSTAWNEFSSSMASLIICLTTNQKFNLSKYIFDAMVKHLDGGVKFLLIYPTDSIKPPFMINPSPYSQPQDETNHREAQRQAERGLTDEAELRKETKVHGKGEHSTKPDDSTTGEAVTTASVEVSVVPTTIEEITPRLEGEWLILEPSKFRVLQETQPSSSKDKGKGIMIEPEVPLKRKIQIALLKNCKRYFQATLDAELIERAIILAKQDEEGH
ncbi:putative ribonuclease H-like domain-containing protein [Tanacetum coccineum]|uniref:Ribonuclease H-like domain-containing protein n=1 Tax=Tanacetum coccineum TaxID=301880 RepID=A0ABQ5DA88_9ASTR